MAKYDPTSTNYPTSLKDAYGFSDAQIQQLKDRGVTLGDLQSINIMGPPAMETPVRGVGGGGTIGGQVMSDAGKQQLQNASMLKLMLGQQQQPQGTPGPVQPPTGATVMNPLQLPSQQVIRQTPQAPPQVAQQALPPIQQPIIQAPQQQPLSGQNVLNPIPVQLQPVQQYGSGGLVRHYQSGGMVNANLGGANQQDRGVPAPQTMYAPGNPFYATDKTGQIYLYPQQYANATDLAGLLGAAALNSPMVLNPTPSGTPSSKSGVANVGGALIGGSVPTVPQGPWLTNPSVFARATPYTPTAAPTVTPQTPATAVAYAPGQPFATPPAAPGYSLGTTMPQTSVPATQTPWLASGGMGGMGGGGLPSAWGIPPAAPTGPMPAQGAGVPQAFLQAHNSALANAGMAMYAHFGGDPNSASPADIANFHSQLTSAVGQHIAGANQPAAGVKQAATGGLVPGRGNEDTVPALLTPGEYVIPKQQVAQLAARGVLKMQSGGLVQDPDPDPPEARRQPLTASQPSSSSAQTSSPQVGGGRSLVSGLTQAAQTYGSSMSGGGMGGGGMRALGTNAYQAPAGSSAMTVGQLGSGPIPGAGQTMSLGRLPATSGLSSAGAQSALGGVASGLNQAAQAIASSAQPWQMQQSAIPDPSQLPKYQTPTLQPERVA